MTPPIVPAGCWSMMPTMIVEGDHLRGLSGGARGVFIYLAAKARWKDGGVVRIGMEELGKIDSPRTARRAIRELVRAGLIARLRRGGGHDGDVGVFQVLWGEKRPPMAGTEQAKPGACSGHLERQKRPFGVPEAAVGGSHPRDQRSEQQQSAVAAADSAAPSEGGEEPSGEDRPEAHRDILAALDLAGVAEPSRSRLAAALARAGFSDAQAVAMIRTERDRARERGKGVGCVVRGIEAGIRRLQAKATDPAPPLPRHDPAPDHPLRTQAGLERLAEVNHLDLLIRRVRPPAGPVEPLTDDALVARRAEIHEQAVALAGGNGHGAVTITPRP